ncbi:hypothetical protein [Actinoallomurus sp. CA-142502]|uniref:hypothetical protein n=1 Tax=Actinoallomurus sp. CA-142502 TaxID=3239885 RepID=UPI003D91698A
MSTPIITVQRDDLAGQPHTITVERVDVETARARWPQGEYADHIGERAVVERHHGKLAAVCATASELPGGSIGEAARGTARTYGAIYVGGDPADTDAEATEEPLPRWAAKLIDAVRTATHVGAGSGRPPSMVEDRLIDAAFILLRHRFGLGSLNDQQVPLAIWMVEKALKELKAEQRKTARHTAPIRRTHKDGTVCGLKSTAACDQPHVGYKAECSAGDWQAESPTRAIVEEQKRTHLWQAGGAR